MKIKNILLSGTVSIAVVLGNVVDAEASLTTREALLLRAGKLPPKLPQVAVSAPKEMPPILPQEPKPQVSLPPQTLPVTVLDLQPQPPLQLQPQVSPPQKPSSSAPNQQLEPQLKQQPKPLTNLQLHPQTHTEVSAPPPMSSPASHPNQQMEPQLQPQPKSLNNPPLKPEPVQELRPPLSPPPTLKQSNPLEEASLPNPPAVKEPSALNFKQFTEKYYENLPVLTQEDDDAKTKSKKPKLLGKLLKQMNLKDDKETGKGIRKLSQSNTTPPPKNVKKDDLSELNL